MISKVLCFFGLLQPRTVLEIMPENKKFEKEIQFNKQSNNLYKIENKKSNKEYCRRHNQFF